MIARQSFLRYYTNFLFRSHVYKVRNVSSNSVKSGKKYNAQLIVGAAVVGGAGIYAYKSLFKNKKPSTLLVDDNSDDEIIFEPFIEPDLEENLTLLEQFGPVPYLLIGAGSASFTAFRAIRTKDPTAKVIMIGDESFLPYMRPPLSKEMWFDEKADVAKTLSFSQWNGKERSIFFESPDFFFNIKELLDNKNGGISVIRGLKVVKIDPVSQVVFLNNGKQMSYEKCLLATGARPKNLPVFEQADDTIKKHITLFRSVRDFQRLDKISRKGKSIVIVGGGYLGSELACGLAKRSKNTNFKVTQVFPESGNMGKVLPEYLSKWVTKKIEDEGVNVHTKVTVKSIAKVGSRLSLCLSNDEQILTDHVVVAVGAVPNTDLASTSGLEIDPHNNGFLVNAELEARKNLYVAGDACCFYDTKLGRRRVEHHDHAVVSGRLAGENMTGSGKPYWHQSMFWSDLGPDVGYEGIGIVDSTLPTVGVFAKATETDTRSVVESTGESALLENKQDTVTGQTNLQDAATKPLEVNDDYRKGVIFYLRDNIVVGIVLWNVFTKMSIARKIINEGRSYDDLTEVAKLFELHTSD